MHEMDLEGVALALHGVLGRHMQMELNRSVQRQVTRGVRYTDMRVGPSDFHRVGHCV
jgi:hypothetical protein